MDREAVAHLLAQRGDELALALVALHYTQVPDLMARYGEEGRAKCLQDATHHLSYLQQAVAVSDPQLFVGYVEWGSSVLQERGIPLDDLVTNLRCLVQVLRTDLEGYAELAVLPVERALVQLGSGEDHHAKCLLDPESPHAKLAREWLDALLAGDRRSGSRLILEAADRGVSVRDLYLHVFQPCQREVGRLWQRNDISVAQEHFCTAATQLVMSQLYPRLFTGRRRDRRLVATCVSGDLHEIGVRMVADFFEMEGWDTFYLGANTPLGSVKDTLREQRAHVLAISATIASHLPQVRDLIAAIRAQADFDNVVILVGGYPFNRSPDLWRELGADGSSTDADGAMALAEAVLESRSRG